MLVQQEGRSGRSQVPVLVQHGQINDVFAHPFENDVSIPLYFPPLHGHPLFGSEHTQIGIFYILRNGLSEWQFHISGLEISLGYILHERITEQRRNVLPVDFGIGEWSVQIVFEGVPIYFGQAETSPQQVESFVVVNPFVFPAVGIPERFERMGFAVDDYAVPAMPSGAVSPFGYEIDGRGHTQGG